MMKILVIKAVKPRILTAQKVKFSIKDLFSKCDQIHSFLHIWSYSLKKSLTENFIFCAVPCTLIPRKGTLSITAYFF